MSKKISKQRIRREKSAMRKEGNKSSDEHQVNATSQDVIKNACTKKELARLRSIANQAVHLADGISAAMNVYHSFAEALYADGDFNHLELPVSQFVVIEELLKEVLQGLRVSSREIQSGDGTALHGWAFAEFAKQGSKYQFMEKNPKDYIEKEVDDTNLLGLTVVKSDLLRFMKVPMDS